MRGKFRWNMNFHIEIGFFIPPSGHEFQFQSIKILWVNKTFFFCCCCSMRIFFACVCLWVVWAVYAILYIIMLEFFMMNQREKQKCMQKASKKIKFFQFITESSFHSNFGLIKIVESCVRNSTSNFLRIQHRFRACKHRWRMRSHSHMHYQSLRWWVQLEWWWPDAPHAYLD